MKKTALFLAITTVGMAGCGSDDDKQTVDRDLVESSVAAETLYFAYPSAGQKTVPASAPVILRYTRPITTPEDDLAGRFALETTNGDRIGFKSAELTENNQGVILKPERTLEPATDYTLISGGIEVGGRLSELPDSPLNFRTAPARNGAIMDQTEGLSGFSLERVAPYSVNHSDTALGSNTYPITDLSTLRLQLSEPVKAASVQYGLIDDGGTVQLINAAGELVPASVLARGNRITIDPDEDLTPGESYRLGLSSGVTSTIASGSLAPVDLSFEPITTKSPEGIREMVAQTAENSGDAHKLTGKVNNSVGLDSTLLGSGNQTIQTGDIFADLAFIPNFERRDQSTPLSIPAGSRMAGTSVEVKVAGELPAGFESGDVNVQFLTDADGFLMPNPYTDDPNAPRLVELYADLSMSTDGTTANGGLAQSLLHVQLVGTAIVEEGKLVLEATGVIEPAIQGVDTGSSLISFRLEGYRNAEDVPLTTMDMAAPTVKSWVPGENEAAMRPGDPIVVFFSEPLAPGSVSSDSIRVSTNSGDVSGDLVLNGSAVTFNPDQPLQHNVDYTLDLTNGVTDLAGNGMTPLQASFRLPDTDAMPNQAPDNQAPLALTVQPGYPCAKTVGAPADGDQGRCLGGGEYDDLLPVLPHPASRPITVGFSQTMHPESINGDTVRVEANENGTWTPVDANVELKGRTLTITPLSAWQAGVLYRYRLVSGDSGMTSVAGLPLQTQFLNQGVRPEDQRTAGGPDMVNYFRGGPDEERVFLPLKNLSAADANGDLEVSESEQGVSEDNGFAPIPNSSIVQIPEDSVTSDPVDLLGLIELSGKPVTGAQIGCEVGESCPEKGYIYMTSGLDTAVAGEAIDGRVSVKLYPTTIYTSSSDVHVEVDEALAGLTGEIDGIPTGPMLMRMRFQQGESGRNELIDGFIYTNDAGQLTFETMLDVYLDAPYLEPELLGSVLDHNLRSFPIDNLKLRGPVTFLEDGRMQIEQRNLEPVNLEGISINGSLLGLVPLNVSLTMSIPENGLYLNFLSPITQLN